MNRKRIFLPVLCLVLVLAVFPVTAHALGGVAIDEKNFPDETLREYVAAEFDADGDGVLSAEEVEAAQEVDLSDSDAADLTGLTSLAKLRSLDVSNTRITTVNTARFPELETLKADGSGLTALDVSKNPAIKELSVGNTAITKLNVSRNPALERLVISGCQIKSLDLSKNPGLTVLLCGKTALTGLDVSKNTALTELDCSGIGLKKLDVTGNEALEILNCGGNKLSELDLTNNTLLRELRCPENAFTTLDVTPNEALEVLDCSKNSLYAVNVSDNPALREFYCQENWLSALYLENNPALERMNCSKNIITDLALKQNTQLEWLECGGNSLSSINLTGNRWLKHLSCIDNLLHKLTLSKNPDLEWVECWGNDLHALDISNNEKLLEVYRYGTTVEYKRRTVRSYARGYEVYEIGTDTGLLLQDGSLAAPLITAHPKDATVVEGKRVTFKISAVGQSLLFQWYYRLPGSEVWIRLPGETGRSLTLTAEKALNGCRYMCEVLNRGGLEQSEKGQLTVISKPEIIYQPANQSAPDGDKVTFVVTARGEKLTYQWYRLTPNSSAWDKVDSGITNRLTLTANAAHDGTRYRCVVKNEAGKVTSSEAKLTVIYKPSITTHPKDTTAKKGKTITLSVKATGGQLRYQWYEKLKGATSWTPIAGATDRTLDVRVTPKKDNAEYRCKVYNAAGHVYSDTARLHIQK